MKRFFSMLVSMLGLAWIIYILTIGAQQVDLLTLVPRQSGAVITWDHPARAFQRFSRTRLGKNIGSIDRARLLGALGLPAADISAISTWGDLWHVLKGKWLVRSIFRKKIVLALVPAGKGAQAQTRPAMQPLFLAAVSKGHIADRLRSTLQALQSVTPLPTRHYQGYSIYGVTIENIGPLYMSCAQGVFLAAVDPAPIRQSLDLLLAGLVGDGNTIRENPAFQQFGKRVKGAADFFCYLDPVQLAAKAVHLPVGHEKITTEINGVIQGLVDKGLRRFACYHRREKKVHQLGLLLRYDRQSLPPFQKRLAGRPPLVDRELARTTADLQLYLQSNWLDLPAWWRQRVNGGTGKDLMRARRLDRAVRGYTGMDMERFLGLFGHRFSLIVKEFKPSSFFPIPRLCLRIALADKIVLQELLEKFIAQLPHRRERVAGVEVVTILAAGGLMQPSCGLSDLDLLLIDGHDLVDDLLAPGDLLVDDPDFIRVAVDSDQPANFIFFTRMEQVAKSLKDAAFRLGAIITVQDGIGGERNKILVEQLALPVFDGLGMFKAGFVIGRTRPGELELTIRLLVGDR